MAEADGSGRSPPERLSAAAFARKTRRPHDWSENFMSWTDERIDRLKKMWSDGATASQIADELGGVSRNAVIGKAHRLGLEQRPSPVKPGEEKEAKKAAPVAASPKSAAPKAEVPKPATVAAAPAATVPAAPANPPRSAPEMQ